jgi:tetratricopeptide (TPR) repeat protein
MCRQHVEFLAAAFTAVAMAAPLAAQAHGVVRDQIDRVTHQIEHAPRDARLHFKRAGLHHARGEHAAAARDLDTAKALAPTWAEVDLARGRLMLDAKRPADAQRALSRYLAREPGSAAAHLERARAARALGRIDAAVSDFDIALAAQPDPDAHIERAQMLLEARPQTAARVLEALRGLEIGLARLGPLVTLELAALDAELALKHHDAALLRLDRLMQTASRKETWLLRRGDVLHAAGRELEAHAAWQQGRLEVGALAQHLRHVPAVVELEQQLDQRLAQAAPRMTSSISSLGANP